MSAPPPPAPRPFARVLVHGDLASAAAHWDELEGASAHSAYQTRAFAGAWLDTIGAAQGWRAGIVVALDGAGRPVALLPLGIVKRGPIRLAAFLGAKDCNYGLGLFREGVAFSADDVAALLREAGRAGDVDLFQLLSLPALWAGAPNPLLGLPHDPAPSNAFGVALESSGEAFLTRRLSKDARKKLRQKEKKLEERGALALSQARTPQEARAFLAASAAQRGARMKEKGLDNVYGSPAAQAFLERLAVDPLTTGDAPTLELHVLTLEGRVVASFGGLPCQGRHSGLFISFDANPDIARSSPGDLMLRKLVRDLCDTGASGFDLGVGEARYKRVYCDEEALFDVAFPVTALGRAAAAAMRAARRLKGRIKRDPRLWALIERARRLR